MGAPVGAGAAPIDLGRTTTAGSLNDTGNPLDVAIVGAGYFQVKRADGTTALTRNGQFTVDGNGSIVTQTGERLVPPITLPKGTDPSTVTIASDGQVTAGGTAIGKISVVDVTNPGGLLSVGNNLFVATAASGAPAAARGSTLQQGAIESSNVDLASAMTEMIEAQRGFQFASRAISTQDQLLNDANQLVR
jgi:flagellar basal-body rod protein FlgG